MLNLGKYGRLTYDGEPIDQEKLDLEEFFVANLSTPISFDENLMVEELLDHYSNLREFINSYFSEHYNTLKTVVLSKKNSKHYVGMEIYKKLVFEDGYVHMVPAIRFLSSDDGFKQKAFMSMLPVTISNTVEVIEEIPGEHVNAKEMKCDITLQDITEALFQDLTYDLTEGAVE
jgi:hypothetical protein